MKLFAVTTVYIEGDGMMVVDCESYKTLAVFAENEEDVKKKVKTSCGERIERITEVDRNMPLGNILLAFGIGLVAT